MIEDYYRLKLKLEYRDTWHCPTCEWWYDDGTCDMCAYGYPYTIDNNGLKPEEVKKCNAYIDKYKEID